MPTGYTCVIDDGGDFKEYFHRCKSAFIRSDDDEPKRPEEISYYRESVEDAKRQFDELKKKDPVEAYNVWFAETSKRYAKYLSENNAICEKYAQVRMKVADWSPPTNKHVEFKKFMLSQLDVGEPTDISEYYQPPTPCDPRVWYADQIADARDTLMRRRADLEKHLENVDAGQEWFDALMDAAP